MEFINLKTTEPIGTTFYTHIPYDLKGDGFSFVSESLKVARPLTSHINFVLVMERKFNKK
jgi:hypothetical protein